MPGASRDWGTAGVQGFTRDPANEQLAPLAPNAVFTGGWTRIDVAESFLLLYGTHVPFTMQIQWSADGVTRDTDPFATITPQVRFALGLYSVISPQSTFFRPYYRIVVTNGPSQQFFVVSDALLLKTVFPGYAISVDGPIPVLGLANLNIGLAWAKTPTGWEPQQLTALKNQKVALAENLLGDLPVAVSNFPAPPAVQPVSGTVALDPVSLAALENITVLLDAASLAALESITVQNNVSTDMLDRVGRLVGVVSLDAATLAALETINAIVSGTVAVSNFPATQPVSGTVALDAASLAALESITAVISGTVSVSNHVSTDMLDRVGRLLGRVASIDAPVALDAATLAALETINAIVSGTVAVSNLPAVQPVSQTGGTFTHLSLVGTTVVKSTSGVLERVVINKISAAAVVTLTLYNGLTVAAPVIAAIQIGATAPGSSGVAAPTTLDYFASFAGLTAVLSAVGADVTLVWR